MKSRFLKFLFYPAVLFFLPGLCNALANVAGGENTGADVTAYMAEKNVVLANGIVTPTISPTAPTILSLRYQGHEMVSQRGRHKTIYFNIDRDKGYDIVSGCVFSIK